MNNINKIGTYRIINTVNGKCYYGSAAISFRRRWNTHKYDLRHNKHGNKYLQSAWNKYGEEAFIFEIIHICPKEECLYWEQALLDTWFDNKKMCYNINPTAGSNLGKKFDDEFKKKSSELRKIMYTNPQNHPMYGKQHSQETIEKLRVSHLGKKPTKETIIKLSGENRPAAKLTWQIVDEIRIKYSTGNYTHRQLAKEYQIDHRNIGRIIKYEAWSNK